MVLLFKTQNTGGARQRCDANRRGLCFPRWITLPARDLVINKPEFISITFIEWFLIKRSSTRITSLSICADRYVALGARFVYSKRLFSISNRIERVKLNRPLAIHCQLLCFAYVAHKARWSAEYLFLIFIVTTDRILIDESLILLLRRIES